MESEMPSNGSGFPSASGHPDSRRDPATASGHGVPGVPQRLRPAPWTPEDATKLIVASIREMQSPMLQSLKRSGVPKTTFFLTVFLLALVIAGTGYLLYDQKVHYNEQVARQEALFRAQLAERDAQLARERQKADASESAKASLQDRIADKAFQALDTVSRNEQTAEQLTLTQTELAEERKRATGLREQYAAILADMNQQATSLAEREAAAARMERQLILARKEAESVTDLTREQQDRITKLADQLAEAQLLIREQKRTIDQLRENFRRVADVFEDMEKTPPAALTDQEAWVPGTSDAPTAPPAPATPKEPESPDAPAAEPSTEARNESGWVTRTTDHAPDAPPPAPEPEADKSETGDLQ